MIRKYSTLTPTNNYYKPEHSTRFVITRKKAAALVDILTKDYSKESALLVPRINYELHHGSHDTHIAFYADEDNVDELTAIQLACMQLMFVHIEIGV